MVSDFNRKNYFNYMRNIQQMLVLIHLKVKSKLTLLLFGKLTIILLYLGKKLHKHLLNFAHNFPVYLSYSVFLIKLFLRRFCNQKIQLNPLTSLITNKGFLYEK
jgi:hypothetical protein